jgi:Rod binding domain-containing protein
MDLQAIQPTGAAAATPSAAEQQALHKAALGFEQMFIRQLAIELTRSTEGEEGADSSAAANTHRSLLPDALAQSIVDAGGIGLAASLERSLGGTAR